MDLGEYLDQWMVRQRLRLRPRTWDGYRLTIDTYITPDLAHQQLDALGPAAIEQLCGELLDHGGRNDRPLSLATIRHVHAVLHKALADAVRIDLLPANPADRVALPRHDLRDDAPATVQAWTAEEARRFLRQTRDDVHANLWAVALGTGMRRGELLGLRWRDVALDDRLITVAGALTEHRGQVRRTTTKTNRIRRLFVDDRTAEALARERRARSPMTAAAGDLADLVFTDADGTPLSPQRTTHRFRRLVRRLDDVPTIRLHALRDSTSFVGLPANDWRSLRRADRTTPTRRCSYKRASRSRSSRSASGTRRSP